MRVLSLVHQWDAASGVFGDVVREAGHELVERNVAETGLPEEPFGAVLVFGGAMHVDQEHRHAWLHDEDAYLRRLAAESVPVLGVCLGAQLLARALGAPVRRMPSSEIGWHEVELTPEAGDDALFAGLPARFRAFQWHSYAFAVPPGGVLLARNERCPQAYRAGETAWGVQFHAEVTPESVEDWIESSRPDEDGALDAAALQTETGERIGAWNRLGGEICRRFLVAAEAAIPRGATTRARSPRSS
ncbi:MAG TPA: type 1 glutamine amidotransferase [Gaiellaceae bacterium]|nr:type 1 glutamine amidotransferase [Gaiellaceae bacterium]